MLKVFSHPSSHEHVTPQGHPERVARIEIVDQVLEDAAFASLGRELAPEATNQQLVRAHTERYVDQITTMSPENGWVSLDPDTHMSPGSLAAAKCAAGANVAAVDAVMGGAARAAFCAVRPCGHHAERERAMGFCLFSNIAVGALYALDDLGAARVAIIDFDVHHGNGTQDIFWNDSRVLFASSHQMPLFPGTGAAGERGEHDQIVNTPLRPMTATGEMRAAFENQILPAVKAHRPDLIMISAGFDAHQNDPLANLLWTADDFRWATERLTDAAAELCEGRVVSTLEGGYDLDGLAESLTAHLEVLASHAA
ncbi:MAG: histone deacetylase family protein [Pseudomonadota bacterium]